MKKVLFSICLSLFALALNANPVTYQTARQVAENFATSQNVPVTEMVNLAPEQMFNQLYVFGFRGQKGFVVVAADDRSIPILGYSFTTEFQTEDMPDHILSWLHSYEEQIDWLIENHIEPSAEVQRRWSMVLNPENETSVMNEIIVDALMTTTWAQHPFYNELCPEYSGTHASTGCVATATAQIMKYWNHPATGHGSYSYSWRGETLSADFGNTTYDWNNMPDKLTRSSDSAEVNAVATLIYHVGVAVAMKYYTGGSGAQVTARSNNSPSAEWALKNFFKYSNSLHNINYSTMTDTQWKNTLKNELDNARPILYSGLDTDFSGHSFVCDGYDSGDYFHFNMGWGGSCDGFYAIGALNTSEGSFNCGNVAVIGIQPISGSIPSQTVVTAAANDTAYGYVTGAGIYNSYDTIKLTAFANEGYCFHHWDDGDVANPRFAPATSSTFNRTAYFIPLPTDTICYGGSDNIIYSLYEPTDTCHWGFRYPASVLRSGRVVDAVQLFSSEAGIYNIIIYQGDSTDMTQVYADSLYVPSRYRWVDLPLATPYPIDTTRSLWVTLKRISSGSPMTASSYFSGSRNGMIAYFNSAWHSEFDYGMNYTWLLRAIVSDSAASMTRYNVDVVASPAYGGSVTPSSTRVFAGNSLTFAAAAAKNYKFVGWSDGYLDYQRTITPTSDTTLTAIFEPLQPDTTTYCISDECTSIMGYKGKAYYWAVRINAGLYSEYDSIKSIMIFDRDTNSFDFSIFIGDNTSGTPVYIHPQSVQLTQCKQWIEIPLSSPVACPVDQDLWIRCSESAGSHAASASRYSGNADGCYYSSDGENWSQMSSGGKKKTWMLKAVVERGTPPVTGVQDVTETAVTLAPNPTSDRFNVGFASADNQVTVSVVDLSGRVIFSQTLGDVAPGQEFTFSLADAPDGVYMVHIAGSVVNETYKLVKQ